MSEEVRFWKEATDFWYEHFLAVYTELKHQREETKFWMKAFGTAQELREDAESEIKEQKVRIQTLEDKVWWLSGGF